MLTQFPFTERPIRGKLLAHFLDIPLTKNRANHPLIASQELYIDVVVIPRLGTHKEIERPAASNPPGNSQRGEEAGDLAREPRLPRAKMVCIVWHIALTSNQLNFSFVCRLSEHSA